MIYTETEKLKLDELIQNVNDVHQKQTNESIYKALSAHFSGIKFVIESRVPVGCSDRFPVFIDEFFLVFTQEGVLKTVAYKDSDSLFKVLSAVARAIAVSEEDEEFFPDGII